MQLTPAPGIEPHVRKIAVLRANALGDFLLTLPALAAVRAAYPQADIVLLARPWHAAFLAGRPSPVDRVIVIPSARGITAGPEYRDDATELDTFFATMVREHFDIAVQLHGGGRHSNPFTRRLGAQLSIGLKAPNAAPLDRWIPYVNLQHEILRYLEVVALIGARPIYLQPHIAVVENDLSEAWQRVPTTTGPLVALHPGATDPRRRWPVEKFARVGDALARAGAQVVVTGTAEERHLTSGVVRAMSYPAQDLCGLLSLGGLAGLLRRCSLAISNDSGPLHLAAAVGTPTVGVYWAYNLINTGPLTRACHRPHVSWRLACPVCSVDCVQAACAHDASLVADVPADEVLGSALDLLPSRDSAQPLAPARGHRDREILSNDRPSHTRDYYTRSPR